MRSVRAALRLVAIVGLMVSLCSVASLLVILLPGARLEKLRLRWILRIKSKHLAWIAWTAGLRLSVEGPLEWPKEPFLLLSNHVSYWDIIAISSLYPMAFVAKSDIARWPLVGFLISQCQTLYVDRTTGEGRFKALLDLKKRLAHCPVCIFPEGTTSARAYPVWGQWYRGQVSVVKRPGVRVFTLALRYEDQSLCAWIDDDALIPHLWRCLQQSSMKLRICLRELDKRHPPELGLAPYAKSAFEQTVELCQTLALSEGKKLGEESSEVANFALHPRLTEK